MGRSPSSVKCVVGLVERGTGHSVGDGGGDRRRGGRSRRGGGRGAGRGGGGGGSGGGTAAAAAATAAAATVTAAAAAAEVAATATAAAAVAAAVEKIVTAVRKVTEWGPENAPPMAGRAGEVTGTVVVGAVVRKAAASDAAVVAGDAAEGPATPQSQVRVQVTRRSGAKMGVVNTQTLRQEGGCKVQRIHAAASQLLRQMVSEGVEVETQWTTPSAPPSLPACKQAAATQPLPPPVPPPRHCVQTRKRQPATARAVTLSAVHTGPVIPNQEPVEPIPRPQSHPCLTAPFPSCTACANQSTDEEPQPGVFRQVSARAPARTSTSAHAPRTSTRWLAPATNAAKREPTSHAVPDRAYCTAAPIRPAWFTTAA